MKKNHFIKGVEKHKEKHGEWEKTFTTNAREGAVSGNNNQV